MSENEIKPVAWIRVGMVETLTHEVGFLIKCGSIQECDSDKPLYDQSAIDRLTAERDAAMTELDRLGYIGGLLQEQIAKTTERADYATADRDEAQRKLSVAVAEGKALAADAERYRKIEALAAGTPGQWQAVEDAAFVSHWGCIQNFTLNIDAIDAARAEGGA
ncbi:hypothetical protein D3C81_170050 [compost metagenome]